MAGALGYGPEALRAGELSNTQAEGVSPLADALPAIIMHPDHQVQMIVHHLLAAELVAGVALREVLKVFGYLISQWLEPYCGSMMAEEVCIPVPSQQLRVSALPSGIAHGSKAPIV